MMPVQMLWRSPLLRTTFNRKSSVFASPPRKKSPAEGLGGGEFKTAQTVLPHFPRRKHRQVVWKTHRLATAS
jgi:hypothetical protein